MQSATQIQKFVRGVPLVIKLTDIVKDKNFKNPTPVIKFTVNILIDDMPLVSIPGFMLIDGRIQVPFRIMRSPDGEMRAKVIRPHYSFLSLVHECIEKSDWWQEWPNLPPLVPIVPKNRGDEDEQYNRE